MGLMDQYRQRRQASNLAKSIVRSGIGFKAPNGNAGVLSALASMLQPKWAEAPARDTAQWLDLFNSSPRLDPVNKIAEDVATTEWALYKKVGDDEQEKILDHPLILLFNKPNPLPETTWYSLLYSTEAYMYIAGEAFWVIERSGLNQITEIWMLPPNWVVSTPNQGTNFYEVQTPDGIRMNVEPEDMLYFKEPNLRNPYGRGKGRAKVIGDEIETDEYMAKWSKNFFFNNAQPPVVIEAPGAGQNDVERMQESWMQKYSGIKNAHKPAVLPFNGKVHQLSNSQREMDFVESRKFIRDQANQHFRVPPELMGIIENSNRATIDAADYIYRSSVLVNRLTMIEQTIQFQLVDRFFPNDGLLFQFENVVPEDKEFKLKAANEGFDRGTITIDEWRQENGWDILDGDMGNVYLIPAGKIPVRNPLDATAHLGMTAVPGVTPPSPQAPKPDKPEAPKPETVEEPEKPVQEPEEENEKVYVPIKGWRQKSLSDTQIKSVADQFDEGLQSIEERHAKRVEKFLIAQGKRIASHVGKKGVKDFILINMKADEGPSDDEIADAEARAEDLLESYDWVDEDGLLHEEMSEELLKAAEEGAKLANGIFELGISFNLIREEMLEHIRTEGFDKVVNITGTTKSILRRAVIQGMLEGEGSAALAKRIRESSSEYAYNRSLTIARTESHSTLVKGALETYKQAGATDKQWLTVNDGRERASHKKLNGKVIPIEERFSNRCMYPGDSRGPAEEVIKCRCALIPKFND